MAERLGLTVKALMSTMTSSEISEWMAFDQLKDESYLERIKDEVMTDEERMLKIKSLFGYKP